MLSSYIKLLMIYIFRLMVLDGAMEIPVDISVLNNIKLSDIIILKMLSFLCTIVGFLFNTMVEIFIVNAFAWGQLCLTSSGVEATMARENNSPAPEAILNQQCIFQCGHFTTLPMIVETTKVWGSAS